VTQETFIRLEQLLKIVPVSKSWIFSSIKAGKFPPNFKIGDRCSVWTKSSVDKWMAEKAKEVA